MPPAMAAQPPMRLDTSDPGADASAAPRPRRWSRASRAPSSTSATSNGPERALGEERGELLPIPGPPARRVAAEEQPDHPGSAPSRRRPSAAKSARPRSCSARTVLPCAVSR